MTASWSRPGSSPVTGAYRRAYHPQARGEDRDRGGDDRRRGLGAAGRAGGRQPLRARARPDRAPAIEAASGPFAISQTNVVPLGVSGFGGGTIYYPTSTSEGTFGAVAIAPGYTATQSSMAWLGPRIASQGFVVFTIDTLTTLDQPDSRGRQLLAALDYLTAAQPCAPGSTRPGSASWVTRWAAAARLEAANSRPSLQAADPADPVEHYEELVRHPGADADRRRRERHGRAGALARRAVLQQLPAASDKAYLELNNATPLRAQHLAT